MGQPQCGTLMQGKFVHATLFVVKHWGASMHGNFVSRSSLVGCCPFSASTAAPVFQALLQVGFYFNRPTIPSPRHRKHLQHHPHFSACSSLSRFYRTCIFISLPYRSNSAVGYHLPVISQIRSSTMVDFVGTSSSKPWSDVYDTIHQLYWVEGRTWMKP